MRGNWEVDKAYNHSVIHRLFAHSMTQFPPQDHQSLTQSNLQEGEEEDYFDYSFDEPGREPGKLSIKPDARPTRILLINYNEAQAIRKVDPNPNACIPYLKTNTVSWMDIQGLGSEQLLKQVGQIFDLHPLLLEDAVVHVPQRPKVEDYNQQLMIIAHMVCPKPNENGFESEQVSFVLGKNYLLTFQEEEQYDCFDLVRDRLRTNQGQVREAGADYLTYLLLDAIIDGYFPILEDYGERIEALEDAIIQKPNHQMLEEIYEVRRELLALRRLIWPLRNVINTLIRGSNDLISQEVQIYLRDCYDHVIQILDIIESYRELASSLMDVYLSATGNKMNEVMQLLTVISSVFIPLTFIAGVYGMNFKYMPELDVRWSYFACLGLMGAIAFSLVYFFWRRGWLSHLFTK